MKGGLKMKNFKLFILAAFLLAGFASGVRAESSATAYDQKYYSQQVFVVAYNNNASTISQEQVAILDVTQAVNPNLYLGSYVTTNGATTDSIYVFGVADEDIITGTLGRFCVRGPHKVQMPSTAPAAGTVIGACASSAKACAVTTADGTASGRLGYLLSATMSTDTGDVANTYWAWININEHK